MKRNYILTLTLAVALSALTSCAGVFAPGDSTAPQADTSTSVCNGAVITSVGDGGSISCLGGSVDDCNNVEIRATASTRIYCGE